MTAPDDIPLADGLVLTGSGTYRTCVLTAPDGAVTKFGREGTAPGGGLVWAEQERSEQKTYFKKYSEAVDGCLLGTCLQVCRILGLKPDAELARFGGGLANLSGTPLMTKNEYEQAQHSAVCRELFHSLGNIEIAASLRPGSPEFKIDADYDNYGADIVFDGASIRVIAAGGVSEFPASAAPKIFSAHWALAGGNAGLDAWYRLLWEWYLRPLPENIGHPLRRLLADAPGPTP